MFIKIFCRRTNAFTVINLTVIMCAVKRAPFLSIDYLFLIQRLEIQGHYPSSPQHIRSNAFGLDSFYKCPIIHAIKVFVEMEHLNIINMRTSGPHLWGADPFYLSKLLIEVINPFNPLFIQSAKFF